MCLPLLYLRSKINPLEMFVIIHFLCGLKLFSSNILDTWLFISRHWYWQISVWRSLYTLLAHGPILNMALFIYLFIFKYKFWTHLYGRYLEHWPHCPRTWEESLKAMYEYTHKSSQLDSITVTKQISKLLCVYFMEYSYNVLFSNALQWLLSWAFLQFPLGEWHITLIMISLHWFW